jgi:hypothetical protein
MQSSPVYAATWLAALLAVTAGCSVDDALKHSCVATTDCAKGRVCVEGQCIALDASSAARDSSSERIGDRPTNDALEGSASDALDEAASGDGGAAGDGGASSPDAGRYVPVAGRNYVFVTSRLFSMKGMTIAKADAACNDAARAASLPGSYVAWLSTSAVNARDRLPKTVGWLRTDGAPFVESLTNLLAGRILRPPLFDERGFEVDPWTPVLTGTQAAGVVAAEANCNDWTQTDSTTGGAIQGEVAATTLRWTDGELQSCSVETPFLCFGVDGVAPVPHVRARGKVAFVSDGTFTPHGGLAAADDLCVREARAAGLRGNYLALLSTATATAASRFADVADQTWVRLDGVALSSPRHTLLDDSELAAPLNLTSRGRYLSVGGDDVHTGSVAPTRVSDPGFDCMAWTSDDPALPSFSSNGISNIEMWWSPIVNVGNCSYPRHLYCLEHDESDAFDGGTAAGTSDGGGAGTSDAGAGVSEAGSPGVPNYVFRTAATYPTLNRTYALADAQCDAEAAYAGLPGSYRAWFSTTTVDARDRLAGARGWIRPDGLPFADTITDIVQGRLFTPLDIDPFGNRAGGQPVMTGTAPTGVVQGGGTCHDWTDGPTSGSRASEGLTGTTGEFWTYGTFDDCGHPSVLYCFGVSHTAALVVPRSEGRLAFLSESMFTLDQGLGGADAICNADAARAGLSGSFAALLATSTASAASRFSDFEDSVWVRPDGMALNRPGERLFDMTDVRVTLGVTAAGAYAPFTYVITGAPTPRFVPGSTETCDDWTSTTATGPVLAANVNYSMSWFTDATADCNMPSQIFCLQR